MHNSCQWLTTAYCYSIFWVFVLHCTFISPLPSTQVFPLLLSLLSSLISLVHVPMWPGPLPSLMVQHPSHLIPSLTHTLSHSSQLTKHYRETQLLMTSVDFLRMLSTMQPSFPPMQLEIAAQSLLRCWLKPLVRFAVSAFLRMWWVGFELSDPFTVSGLVTFKACIAPPPIDCHKRRRD